MNLTNEIRPAKWTWASHAQSFKLPHRPVSFCTKPADTVHRRWSPLTNPLASVPQPLCFDPSAVTSDGRLLVPSDRAGLLLGHLGGFSGSTGGSGCHPAEVTSYGHTGSPAQDPALPHVPRGTAVTNVWLISHREFHPASQPLDSG